MKEKPIVYVIVGPTATGKTDVGFLLAKCINGEIISADSMQVYKSLDIGTAKDKSQTIKQYLIDIKNVDEKYSVAEFVKDANAAIEEILNKKKTPIIIGGTGLYITALVNQMRFTEEDPHLINERLVALEKDQALWSLNGESKYHYYIIKLYLPREELYNRINKRVDKMVAQGIEKEAKALKELNLAPDSTSIKAIGYKEFFDYFDKKKTFEQCIEDLKKNTRHYAKRQETWFNKLRNDLILDANKSKEKQVEIILAKKEELYEKKH